jgi:hypothetical protein
MLGETSQGRRAYLADAREKYLANDGRIAARTPLNAACRTQRPPPRSTASARALARQGGGKSAPKHIIICALLYAYTVSKNKQ